MGMLPGWHWKAPLHVKQHLNIEKLDLDGTIPRKLLDGDGAGHEDGVGEVDYKD
jgi:hypothetical protein